MTTEQLKEYAEELTGSTDILYEILRDIIDKYQWHYDTSLEEAVRTHSKLIEKQLKQRHYE